MCFGGVALPGTHTHTHTHMDESDEAALLFLEDLWLPREDGARWGFRLGSEAFVMRPAVLRGQAWAPTDDPRDMQLAEALVVERFGDDGRTGGFDLYVARPRTVRLNARWAEPGVHRLKDEDELCPAGGASVLFQPQFCCQGQGCEGQGCEGQGCQGQWGQS